MNPHAEYMTKEKYDELAKELHHLSTVRRKEIAQDLEDAKSIGDLSENAEYHDARNAQAELEDKIRRLEMTLQNAVIVEDGDTAEIIGIGSEIVVEKKATKEKIAYKIVGSEESDIASGKLSINSPLGSVLIGKRSGESVKLIAPNGTETLYQIISVK